MVDDDKDKLIAKLREEISTLKSIIHKIPGNIFWKNLNGELLGCNLNMAKILKVSSPEDVVNKHWKDFIPAELITEALKNDEKVIATKTEMSIEEEGIDIEGNPAVYVSKKSPFYDTNGKLVGLIGISIDITHQKEIEKNLEIARKKADEANQAKSRFLAMLSHELRTPLTSILGFVSLLQGQELNVDERQIYIKYVHNSANYLLDLVNKLLDFSKLEVNKFDIKSTTFNLKKLIHNVVIMLNSLASVKNLSLNVEYDKHAPEEIVSNEGMLQQILVNLIGNAIKFTKTGSVIVKVINHKKTAKNTKLELIVQDTGIGIPADRIRHIFKEFYQIDDIYTRNASMAGAGLGLAIVKKLVKLIGGKISVTSEVNKGTFFSIIATFPLDNEKSIEILNEQRLMKAELNTMLFKPCILLVEDDKLVQLVHQKMLTNLGCEVNVANNAHQALKMLSPDYHMAFVDIGLPDLNGFDLIKEMKKTMQNWQPIPIVALTGFFTEEEKKRCFEMGADGFLTKPVPQDLLKETLYQFVLNRNKVSY